MKEILVIGATGAMGRPVVEHLLRSPQAWKIRVLTRNPDCEEARDLVSRAPERVAVMRGSPADEASLARAVEGVYGVFCNTNFFGTASVTGERSSLCSSPWASRK